MLSSGRVLQIWLVITLVVAIILSARGLFDQLGYDLGVAMAILAGIAAPQLAAVRVADLRRSGVPRQRSGFEYVLGLFAQIALATGLLLFIPLAITLVRTIWDAPCDLSGGLMWYALIAGVSALYASAIGVFFSLATGGVRGALFAAYAFVLLTGLVAVRHVIADPPTFLFHGIVGYVPGPIYDEEVRITSTVLWGRLGTLVWTAFFVGLAASTCTLRRQRLDLVQFLEIDFAYENVAPRATVVLSVVMILFLHVFRHETGTSPNAAAIQDALGGRMESEHFVIYYDPDAMSEDDVALMVEDHEFRLDQIVDYLGWDASRAPRDIESYVYPTPEVKKRLMGAAGTSYADPFDRAMHLNQAPFPHPVLKHELAHIVSHDFAGTFGFNLRIGLHEGFAVATDWEQQRLTPDQWAAVMKREELLPDLGTITSGIQFWGAPKSRAYLSVGSFVQFLVTTKGPEPFTRFFGDNDYEEHFAASFDSLQGLWLAHLDTVTVGESEIAYAQARLRRRAIFDRHCPREAAQVSAAAWDEYLLGRYRHALAGFDQLVRWSPEDGSARLGRLYALDKLDRGNDAIALGQGLLADASATHQQHDAVREILGDRHWRHDELEVAREYLAANADSAATDRRVRAAWARLSVLEDRTWRRVLTGDAEVTEAAAILARLAAAGPERGLANYLLGRRLFLEAAYGGAADHFDRALADGLPHVSLTAECLRFLGISRYRADDTMGADAAFAQLAALNRFEAEVIRALAWRDRCRWRWEQTGGVLDEPAPSVAISDES